MRTSIAGIELIQQFEGLALASYVCPAGHWTIGYGHTSMAGQPEVLPGMRISKFEAGEILKRDLEVFEQGVRRLVKVGITQGQFDALVSFAFNCGLGALEKSTLLKRVNAHEFDKVPAEFMKWTRGGGKELPGLVRRRRAECALWRGVDGEAQPTYRLVPDMPKPSKTMVESKEGNAALAGGALAAMGAANDAMSQISTTGMNISSLLDLFYNPNFMKMLAIAVIAAAIWYWRRKRLQEEGA